MKIQMIVCAKKKISAIAKKGEEEVEIDLYATGQAWKVKIEAIKDETVRECVAEFMRASFKRMEVCTRMARHA